MRWKDAPVVGTSQGSEKKSHKESILRPSSYAARPENKENERSENHVDSYAQHVHPPVSRMK